MTGRIPQPFIDDLLTRIDIVDVIDARLPLKKGGRDYTACCPFHDEKTPSFTVSQGKQFYHCFGCGAHGTAISFLMEYERLGFIEAVEELAARAGLQVPHTEGEAARTDANAGLYAVLTEAAGYYRSQLTEHSAAARARDYLTQRGLSAAIIDRFGIGYAPPGWDHVLRRLGRDAARIKQLTAAGLLIEKGDRRYDRFRDRIMFPIEDRRGRVVGFGGRVLGEESPKYLNSPETPVFHKGRELYGLHQARVAQRQLQRVLVVEGYMDVVSLAQFDIPYAVATLGTATTPEHLDILFRTAPEVVFCFDGDAAGRRAAWRALENALPTMRAGRQIGFMFLPEGEDPDTLVRREGRERFEEGIVNAVPFSTFVFDSLSARVDTSTMDGRARLVELARPLLAKLPPGVYRDMMVDLLARRVRMEPAQLRGHVAAPGAAPTPMRRPRPPSARQSGPSPMRTAIAMLLHRPALAEQAGAPERFAAIDLPGLDLLVGLIELLRQNPHLNTAALIEHWRGTQEEQYLAKLVHYPVADDNLETEFRETLAHLERAVLDARFEALRAKEHLNEVEKEEFKRLLSRMSPGQAGRKTE